LAKLAKQAEGIGVFTPFLKTRKRKLVLEKLYKEGSTLYLFCCFAEKYI
jgi:hypothetical protein